MLVRRVLVFPPILPLVLRRGVPALGHGWLRDRADVNAREVVAQQEVLPRVAVLPQRTAPPHVSVEIEREQMLPPMRFFLAQLTAAPPSAKVRFVDVAHEFLVTPHAALQHRYLRGVPHSKDHDASTPQKRVLGLA